MVIYTTMKTTQLEIIENLKSLNLELERMLNNFYRTDSDLHAAPDTVSDVL